VLCGLVEPNAPHWKEQLPPHLRPRLTCLGFVPEELLPGLYANAAAVLYPTLYEGFGLPALEAQAVGTPVLMTDGGSLRELAGPGAVVLPAEDMSAWVSAARTVLDQGKPTAAAARAWASGFSWKAAFRKTLDVYKAAAAS
jgi:alpha-1,3-rhamnosyl/mannosyltransferase